MDVEPATREPQELLDELDSIVAGARPFRLTNRVLVVERDPLDAFFLEFSTSVPLAVREFRRYARHGGNHDDSPPDDAADSLDPLGESHIASATSLMDLLSAGSGISWNPGKVYFKKKLFTTTFAELRAWLAPFVAELTVQRSRYPEVREQLAQEQVEAAPAMEEWQARTGELFSLVDELRDLLDEATPASSVDVRIDPAAVGAITKRMRSAIWRNVQDPTELNEAVDRLDAFIGGAEHVRFSNDVRVGFSATFDLVIGIQDGIYKIGNNEPEADGATTCARDSADA